MRQVYTLLIVLLLAGMASAAVYVTTNPEARAFFDRDKPGPDVSPVVTMYNSEFGWTNSVEFGTMTTNYFEKQLSHRNIETSPFVGVIKFDIECAEGLVNDTSGGIKDFNDITYHHPDLSSYSCNDDVCIDYISSTKIVVTPTPGNFTFDPDVLVLAGIDLEFIDMAYGDYTVTVYVDEG